MSSGPRPGITHRSENPSPGGPRSRVALRGEGLASGRCWCDCRVKKQFILTICLRTSPEWYSHNDCLVIYGLHQTSQATVSYKHLHHTEVLILSDGTGQTFRFGWPRRSCWGSQELSLIFSGRSGRSMSHFQITLKENTSKELENVRHKPSCQDS